MAASGAAGLVCSSASLDHVGPFARSASDLAGAYDALQGRDPHDPVCAGRPAEASLPLLGSGADGLRIAVAGGHFASSGTAAEAVAIAAEALGAGRVVEVPEAARARAAAFVITASEGANLHLIGFAEAARRFRSQHARPLFGRRAGAGSLGDPGAAFPALVSRTRVGAVR